MDKTGESLPSTHLLLSTWFLNDPQEIYAPILQAAAIFRGAYIFNDYGIVDPS